MGIENAEEINQKKITKKALYQEKVRYMVTHLKWFDHLQYSDEVLNKLIDVNLA